jgi:predicted enzyme related to lactoylglutathione lyase
MAKKPAPVVHFEIHTKNNKKAKAFYSKLFNWKIQLMPAAMGHYGMVEAGGDKKSQINGGLNQLDSKTKPFTTFYVLVPDLDATLKQAKKLKAKVIMPRVDMKEMGIAIAMIHTPDGNQVGVMSNI